MKPDRNKRKDYKGTIPYEGVGMPLIPDRKKLWRFCAKCGVFNIPSFSSFSICLKCRKKPKPTSIDPKAFEAMINYLMQKDWIFEDNNRLNIHTRKELRNALKIYLKGTR